MTIETSEFKEFRRLHHQLMYFVACQRPVLPFKPRSAADYLDLPNELRIKVHRAFQSEAPALIDAYLAKNPDRLEPDERETVKSWKDALHGKFFVLRQLKKHAVFLDGNSPEIAYGVLGLTQPISDLVPFFPVITETTLLPFQGKIVYDGFLVTTPVHLGSGIRKSLEDSYRTAKASGGILTALGPTPKSRAEPVKPKKKKAVTARQKIDRLVGTLHKKLKEVREKEQTIKVFEDETAPAFREWIEQTFTVETQTMKALREEVDLLEDVLEELDDAWYSGDYKTGLEAYEASLKEVELYRAEEEEVDLDDDNEEGEFGPDEEIPDFILDDLFARFMEDVRGINIDELSEADYRKARDQFDDTVGHAKSGDHGAFEKALYKTGADQSEQNISAVKKAFRKLARKIHPDRNPDFDEESQEIWTELKAAKEALDLRTMERLDTRWRVLRKESFDPKEEPSLKELQRNLNELLAQLRDIFRKYRDHPMWGAAGKEPTPEMQKQCAGEFASDIGRLKREKAGLEKEINRIKKLTWGRVKTRAKKKKATPLAQTINLALKKQAAAKKAAATPNPSHEQTTFDF